MRNPSSCRFSTTSCDTGCLLGTVAFGKGVARRLGSFKLPGAPSLTAGLPALVIEDPAGMAGAVTSARGGFELGSADGTALRLEVAACGFLDWASSAPERERFEITTPITTAATQTRMAKIMPSQGRRFRLFEPRRTRGSRWTLASGMLAGAGEPIGSGILFDRERCRGLISRPAGIWGVTSRPSLKLSTTWAATAGSMPLWTKAVATTVSGRLAARSFLASSMSVGRMLCVIPGSRSLYSQKMPVQVNS